MAWSLVESDNWGVTARLAVEFRRPVPIRTPIRAEGWITNLRRRVVDSLEHLPRILANHGCWDKRI